MAAGWRPTMPDESTKSSDLDTPLAVPGVLCVIPARAGAPEGKTANDRKTIRVGPGAGWMVPEGIGGWERELSFMARADMTVELARNLRATLPHEQIAPKRFPSASRAVAASPLLPIASDLVDEARRLGGRVHTVGVDRVSSDFYYFAEGGGRPAVNVQGNLIEMLAPSLESTSTNADIARLLDGLLDRILAMLSEGTVTELDVELADALPRLARNNTGLEGTNLESFDARARSLGEKWARLEPTARRLVVALADASRRRQLTVRIPLFHEARNDMRPALEILVSGEPRRLPEWPEWTVTGALREETEPAWRTSAKSSPRFTEGAAAAKSGAGAGAGAGAGTGASAGSAAGGAAARAATASNHVTENAVAAGASGVARATPAGAFGLPATEKQATPPAATAPVPEARARTASEPPPPSEPLVPVAKPAAAVDAPAQARAAEKAPEPALSPAAAEAPAIAPQAVVVLDERMVASQRETPIEPVPPAKPERAGEKAEPREKAGGAAEAAQEKTSKKAEPERAAKAARGAKPNRAARRAAAKAEERAERKAEERAERMEQTAPSKAVLAKARASGTASAASAASAANTKKGASAPPPEARRSVAIFVVGLLALIAAVAYSGWRLWFAHKMH